MQLIKVAFNGLSQRIITLGHEFERTYIPLDSEKLTKLCLVQNRTRLALLYL